MQHQLNTEGCKWIMSPTAWMTWSDEDYIGRISRISRRCHNLKTASRAIDRALGHYRRQFKAQFGNAYNTKKGKRP